VSTFTFPQSGDRRPNAAAIPVPAHTLAALLTGALLGVRYCTGYVTPSEPEDFLPPQVSDAIREATALLPEVVSEAAYSVASDTEDAIRREYPF